MIIEKIFSPGRATKYKKSKQTIKASRSKAATYFFAYFTFLFHILLFVLQKLSKKFFAKH